MSATSPGVALVIGDNEFAALQVVRSLGRRSIAVELVCYSEQPITRSSRYVNAAHLFGHPLKQPAEFDAQLLALLKGKRFEVAIPTSENP